MPEVDPVMTAERGGAAVSDMVASNQPLYHAWGAVRWRFDRGSIGVRWGFVRGFQGFVSGSFFREIASKLLIILKTDSIFAAKIIVFWQRGRRAGSGEA
jgi:hypothetical protein